jgi:hypothetical protein
MADGAVFIDSVEPLPDGRGAIDGHLDAPVPGRREPGYAVSFRGWALGRSSPVAAIGVRADGRVVSTLPMDAPRPGMDFHRTSGGDARASIGRWRRDLPPALREQAESAFADIIDAYGYPATLTR